MSHELLQKLDRIHSYPAKFTIDLAIKYIEQYSQKGDTVYDPFVGSGTTLLASKFLYRNSYGSDINFIAILISKFKVLNLTVENFKNLENFILNFKNSFMLESENTTLFNYPSIEHWFCESSIKVLSYIKNCIKNIKVENEMLFCKLVFSSIINLASNQESDTRYACITKPKLTKDYVGSLFVKKFETTLSLMKELTPYLTQDFDTKNIPLLFDSKLCDKKIKNNSVDLILTSPPYPNTYDYYLYHKHRMNWLDFDVKYTMEAEIGSRREFSSLKRPKEKFDDDMFEILSHANNLLKIGGYAILVMGDGKIRGEIYEAKSNMEKLCVKLGWDLVDYSYSYLDNTSRSFQKSYRTKGKKEHILVFKKVM